MPTEWKPAAKGGWNLIDATGAVLDTLTWDRRPHSTAIPEVYF